MRLKKIEISGYRSVTGALTLPFYDGLPTVLVGKNGSGKTSILEAASDIMMNSGQYYESKKTGTEFTAYIGLSEDDVSRLLPGVEYDAERSELKVYSEEENGLVIRRVESEYIVDGLKERLDGVSRKHGRISELIEDYKQCVDDMCVQGYWTGDVTRCGASDRLGEYTDLWDFTHGARHYVDDVTSVLETIKNILEDPMLSYNRYSLSSSTLKNMKDFQQRDFKLKYRKPRVSAIEEKYVKVDEEGIKREIDKINQRTKDIITELSSLVDGANSELSSLASAFETIDEQKEQDEAAFWNLRDKISEVIGKRCHFIPNDNSGVMFQNDDNGRSPFRVDKRYAVTETYLRNVYKGEDRDELLKEGSSRLLSDDALREYERYLNEHIPEFDKGMFRSISVTNDRADRRIQILLHENNGTVVPLEYTSAGRRWYFTYYFVKSTLEKGDVLIIDEPASMLHPSAQKEIMADIMELCRKGVRVIYTTHSPYMIPDSWQCVSFVSMTDNGTALTQAVSGDSVRSALYGMGVSDVFDIGELVDAYNRADPTLLARACYNAVKSKSGGDLGTAAEAMKLSEDTFKSWKSNSKKKFRSPKFENVVEVSRYTGVDLRELIEKGTAVPQKP